MSPFALLVPATVTALSITAAPPILPFTELSDKKIQMVLQHMVDADQCTKEDMDVVMQLDHIRWKYTQMRLGLYQAAREAAPGSTVNAKDLGKMFDAIDFGLDSRREQDLQQIRQEMQKQAEAGGRSAQGST